MKCTDFIDILRFGVEVGIFICICILVSLSSKDPFKSHIFGQMSNYFFNYLKTNNSLVNMCICKNETFEHSCTIENELKGCFNITSDIVDLRPLYKRKLESGSFCTDMQESFARNEGRKLSYIFDLNYQVIRKLSISLLIVCISFAVLFIIIFCYFSQPESELKGNNNKCGVTIIALSSILWLISWIAKFVLSLILYHFIEEGDIGKYDNFLDCKNVK